MITEELIFQALKSVQDPDLHKDIVSLGFVKDIVIDGGKVAFKIELTTPACPVKDLLKQQSHDVVAKINGVTSVEITMTSRIPANKGSMNQSNLLPGVKNVIAVASGKGGVGKSTVATNLAVALGMLGAKVGLLDADIYGPSIPLMMGTSEKPGSTDGQRMDPILHHGIQMMSIGFLMPEEQALVWRGPMVAQALTQLMRDVAWGELDYLIVDMPPGTGDAQLTLSQVVHLVGAVIVTTPQDVALLDAKRGVGMFQKVNVPILGIIENMSYYVCPNCNHRTDIFSHGGAQKAAEKYEVPFLGEVPLDIETRMAGDAGTPIVLAKPDSVNAKAFMQVARNLASMVSIIHYGTAEDRSKALGQKTFFANTRLKVI
ncbi:MAG TPA: iron-sulfur cluster carrier protein ApbC [bacterium]|nr:iron-sulfur cluster carrier protein ApbC [bacterium]HNC48044.1 iron-sulfur cluster carrier protein ApbC [bacterium]